MCFFCLVFVMLLYASVYLCLVITCWERADLLALVVSFSLSHWYPGSVYRFLIFAPLLSYTVNAEIVENFIFAIGAKRHICSVKIRDFSMIYVHQ